MKQPAKTKENARTIDECDDRDVEAIAEAHETRALMEAKGTQGAMCDDKVERTLVDELMSSTPASSAGCVSSHTR